MKYAAESRTGSGVGGVAQKRQRIKNVTDFSQEFGCLCFSEPESLNVTVIYQTRLQFVICASRSRITTNVLGYVFLILHDTFFD